MSSENQSDNLYPMKKDGTFLLKINQMKSTMKEGWNVFFFNKPTMKEIDEIRLHKKTCIER